MIALRKLPSITIAQFLGRFDDVIWCTLYRLGKEKAATSRVRLQTGDILVVGLSSETTLKAWRFVATVATPCALPEPIKQLIAGAKHYGPPAIAARPSK